MNYRTAQKSHRRIDTDAHLALYIRIINIEYQVWMRTEMLLTWASEQFVLCVRNLSPDWIFT